MEYKNLDKALAYQDLVKLDKVSLKNNLTVKRIKDYQAPAGAGLTYSYAAMPVNKEIIDKLQELCDEQELVEKYVALLSGEMMNPGEKRLVLHQLTRGNCTGSKVYADDEEKDEFYKEQLERIKDFSGRVRSGKIKSSTGKKFDTVCQIGIGGSDLGPRALYLALKGWATGEGKKQLRAEFISNVDPDDAASVLKTVNPETTLFVLVSKSGTTLETLTNQLLVTQTLKGIDMSKQLVAVTSKTSPLAKSDDVLDAFYIDDYIGGRYSSTSAVGGVILSLALGYDTFEALLKGAHEADNNALNGDIRKNSAMMDAAIGVYLRNVLGMQQTAILPYSQALCRFLRLRVVQVCQNHAGALPVHLCGNAEAKALGAPGERVTLSRAQCDGLLQELARLKGLAAQGERYRVNLREGLRPDGPILRRAAMLGLPSAAERALSAAVSPRCTRRRRRRHASTERPSAAGRKRRPERSSRGAPDSSASAASVRSAPWHRPRSGCRSIRPGARAPSSPDSSAGAGSAGCPPRQRAQGTSWRAPRHWRRGSSRCRSSGP